jgi:glycosyltransferase involved in cell wall biosynthesis
LTSALDIATSSSRSEAFPHVIGEAISCVVPCVITDVGDSASIVGDTWIIVPPGNQHALANGCIEIINM